MLTTPQTLRRFAGATACAALALIFPVASGAAASHRETPAPVNASTPSPQAKKLSWPPAVEAAFKRAYPTATVENVSKETENGRTQYEVESIDNGHARDLNYLADGSVVDMEEAVDASDVPPVVTAAITARYPKAKINRREKLTITKDHVVQYEFGVTGAGAKVTEIVLTPDGQWVSPKK